MVKRGDRADGTISRPPNSQFQLSHKPSPLFAATRQRTNPMFDHISLRTHQFDVMTAFYEQALDAPGLWISTSTEPPSSVHLALSSPDKSAVPAFHAAALRAGAKDNGARARATSPRTITPPSSSTPATTLRRSAAAPKPDPPEGRRATLRDRLRRSASSPRPVRQAQPAGSLADVPAAWKRWSRGHERVRRSARAG